MIQKIRGNEYIKRVGNMTAQEKRTFAGRVGEWLREKAPLLVRHEDDPLARVQGVMQIGVKWNDAEQQAWTEGVRLLTAFVATADTWLPDMLYTKAVRRSIRNMVEILKANVGKLTVKPVSAPDPKPKPTPTKKNVLLPKPKNYTSTMRIPIPTPAANEASTTPPKRKRGRPRKNPLPQDTKPVAQNAKAVAPNANSVAQPANNDTAKLATLQTVDPNTIIPRPKHIDQYAYLLPEKTQQRAAQYGPLMRDLGSARQNMQLLMDDPKANATERERWAKVAVKIDNQIKSIRLELDEEWNKVCATGRVTIDDLGMAHIIDPATGKINDPKPKVEIPREEKPKKPSKPKRQYPALDGDEKAKRILYLQKWLRDPRPAATEEHVKQWEENARELVHYGGNITDAIRKTGEHYKARIPKVKQK